MFGDNPISKPEDDVLGRENQAKLFSERLLNADYSKGLAVGVLGSWGSGKTSFLNLMSNHLRFQDVPVLDFNPWMFSGADQLVQAFFVELSSQLKVRPGLKEVGESLETYGEVFSGMGWLPFVGPWLERGRKANNAIARILQLTRKGIEGPKGRAIEALGNCTKPIVVVVDDVDRLTSMEIRDIFKLVRLTANFPNIIYVVAFDRSRVEEALEVEKIPGRDYLEKILQLVVDLPKIPREVLDREIVEVISLAVGEYPRGPFELEAWPDVLAEVIRPLIRNMRDIRRYALAIEGTISDLSGQVNLVDVLALEAIRVFSPDLFAGLATSSAALTTVSGRGSTDPLSETVRALVEVDEENINVARNLILRLFPYAASYVGGTGFGIEWNSRFLTNRRVACEEVFRYYLERVANATFSAFVEAEIALTKLDDNVALRTFFDAVKPENRQDTISALENFADSFRPEQVVPGSITLLNLMPELPERNRGMFDINPRMAVIRVVRLLLKTISDPSVLKVSIDEILARLDSLTLRAHLISLIGYTEGVGLNLISENDAEILESDWLRDVRSSPVDSLVAEPDLFAVYSEASRLASDRSESLNVNESTRVTLGILRAAKATSTSQPMGGRAVSHTSILFWDELVKIYGSEDVLHQRIVELLGSREYDVGDNELFDLVNRYRSGERPGPFGAWARISNADQDGSVEQVSPHDLVISSREQESH